VVSAQFTPSPEWVVGPRGTAPFTGEPEFLHGAFPVPLLLLAVAAATVFFWRTRDNRQLRLLATVAVALTAGGASVVRTLGPAFPYRLRWAQALGMITGVVVVYAAWRAITRARPSAERPLRVVAYTALVAFAIGNSVAAATEGTPYERRSEVIDAIVGPTERALPDRQGAVVVRYTSFASSGYSSGLILALEKAGDEPKINRNPVAYGDHRHYENGDPLRAVLTVAADREVDSPQSRALGRLVAYWGEKSRAEHRRLERELAELRARCDRGEVTPDECFERSARIEPGRAIAVYLRSTL
jgi:hypothetical protein